jgi:hypothetical protein
MKIRERTNAAFVSFTAGVHRPRHLAGVRLGLRTAPFSSEFNSDLPRLNGFINNDRLFVSNPPYWLRLQIFPGQLWRLLTRGTI